MFGRGFVIVLALFVVVGCSKPGPSPTLAAEAPPAPSATDLPPLPTTPPRIVDSSPAAIASAREAGRARLAARGIISEPIFANRASDAGTTIYPPGYQVPAEECTKHFPEAECRHMFFKHLAGGFLCSMTPEGDGRFYNPETDHIINTDYESLGARPANVPAPCDGGLHL